MQGLVTLDFGNTRAVAGIFLRGETPKLLHKLPLSELSQKLSTLGLNPGNTQLALSSVKPREEELAPLQEEGYLVTRVKDYWRGKRFHGMVVNYSETLGEDRLICAFYAYKKMKEKLLLVDAGTYLTLDVVTPEGFQGGFIAPGSRAYFESFGGGVNLRETSLELTSGSGLPQTTPHAMSRSYGAFGALAREIIREQHIQKVLITGGDGGHWANLTEGFTAPPVVESHPDLIHFALYYWMTTQIELV